jgi:phosphoribosylamine--glycine ligase
VRALVVGSGAREHALAWGLREGGHEVLVVPGNDGVAAHGIACTSEDPEALACDLAVIGPEAPLVAGLADRLRARGRLVVGPGADGARLEASKSFMKEFLVAAGVPTARHGTFGDPGSAREFLSSLRAPYVVKTDGLAAGKGVLVTEDLAAATADVEEKLSGRAFGEAGTTVVIEEGLVGEECSLLVLTDGVRAVPLAPAQDFKRVGDGGTGPNTGGMGVYAPMPLVPGLVEEVMASVISPTLVELARRGIEYRGVLYAGLMLTPSGPQLLEYNVRFGDPETEALVLLYREGLAELLEGCARGELGTAPVARGAAVTVVLAAHGYPEAPRAGDVISGLGVDGQLAEPVEGVVIFHAGTRRRPDGAFETAGGRVLAVSAHAATIAEARERAYRGAEAITFSGKVQRGDIAREVEGAM